MKWLKMISLLCILLVPGLAQQKPYLSNLSASKDSPIYTTYAAPMGHSEFTLDEGYHFRFYDPDRGADFVTDNAGDWSIGFRKGSRFVCEVKEMFKAPIITLSYPDVVRYYYFPFEDIRVDATFLVRSSRLAVQEIVVTNVGARAAAIDVVPFLQNNGRTFNDVRFIPDRNAITFSHEEFPDAWVLEHKVPYVDIVQDAFVFSEKMDRLSSFQSYRWGPVEIPQQIQLEKPPFFIVWGRIFHRDKERCRHLPPATRFTVTLSNDRSRILIEDAPRWGGTESNINAYSLYGIELGNFGRVQPGDSFAVRVSCLVTQQETSVEGVVPDTSKTHDMRFDARMSSAMLLPPEGVQRDIWGSGTELRLYWKKGEPGVRYNVYRRDCSKSAVYELVASEITQTFFTDKNIPDDKVYSYVVAAIDGKGNMSNHSAAVNNIEGSDFLTDVKYPGQVKGDAREFVKVISASKRLTLTPGETRRLRIVRGVRRPGENQDILLAAADSLMNKDFATSTVFDERLFQAIPRPTFTDPDKEMMYWSAFSMMRQVMLPPEGKSSYNYYVFSREPQWGWGHGGQVFHESMTMMAYANMDPVSAMNSQRVYRERQLPDGYINYRTGAYLDETIPYENQLTTSAPWYAWQNWEIYLITKDKKFLQEMYESSRAFYQYYVSHRDSDGDGLCEWGGEAVLESVRDGLVAVWDNVGWPSNFEALDLNVMLAKEEKSLEAMAAELGRKGDAEEWGKRAADRAKKVNELMWDDSTGFYYHVDKKTHTFTHKSPNDLKRQEIIGFLPLWAGIASEEQAKRLVQTLTDPKKFWRRFGVPTLAADDPYYNPKGYWNGPVWIQWDYLIERGLLDYGFKTEAREMVNRIAANMIGQLKKDHNLWELYCPDEQWAGFHKTYIWAGIITRMMLDAGAE